MYHTGYHFNMSMNLEIRQQQSCVLFPLGTRREFGIFARSVRAVNFCSALHGLAARDVKSRPASSSPPLYAATLPRPVCESYF